MILDNILEAFFMGAALAGIYTIWHRVTETCESVTCEKCREDFSDDEYDEDELVNGKLLCESCRDDIICSYLLKK